MLDDSDIIYIWIINLETNFWPFWSIFRVGNTPIFTNSSFGATVCYFQAIPWSEWHHIAHKPTCWKCTSDFISARDLTPSVSNHSLPHLCSPRLSACSQCCVSHFLEWIGSNRILYKYCSNVVRSFVWPSDGRDQRLGSIGGEEGVLGRRYHSTA